MRKSIVTDLTIYGTAEALAKLLNYSLFFLAAILFSGTEYGIISLLFGIQVLLVTLFEWSQGTILFQLYFEFETKGRLRALQAATFLVWLLGGGLLALFTALLLRAFILPRYIPQLPFFPTVALIILAAYFDSFSSIVKQLYRVSGKAFQSATIRVLPSALTLTLALLFFSLYGRTTLSYAAAAFFSLLCSFLLFCFDFLRKLRSIPETRSPKPLATCASLGLPLILVVLTGWVTTYGSRYILNYETTPAAVASYSLAFVLSQPLIYAATIVNMAWIPYLFRTSASSAGADSEFVREYVRYRSFLIWVLVVLGSALPLIARIVQPAFGGDKYPELPRLVPIMVAALIGLSLYYVNISLLYLHKKNGAILLINLIVSVLNILLNLLLVPRWTGFGSAVSYLLSCILLSILVTAYALRLEDLPSGAVHYALVFTSCVAVLSQVAIISIWWQIVIFLILTVTTTLATGMDKPLRKASKVALMRPA